MGRVDFSLDKWQQELLEAVDAERSCLVVAPTSSGKTFVCYYAMERCLREDDEGVVIYVAPTRALMEQVEKEVVARFVKSFQRAGRLLLGSFSRDLRYTHPAGGSIHAAQVLVTEPACLELLLTSAAAAGWASKIRRIIFDEVHNIVADDSGVWERMLLHVPAPILAMSATVGDTEKMAAWLARIEERRTGGAKPIAAITHTERYNDLAYYVWEPPASALGAEQLRQLRAAEIADAPAAGA